MLRCALVRPPPPAWFGACSFVFLGCFASSASRVEAQFGAEAKVERPMASEQAAGDPSAAANRLQRDESPRAAERLEERLAEVPGAAVVRRGAAGSFAGLSLRGAEADQVELFVGEVPVGPVAGGGADLSLWPIEAFEVVEVFRGAVPLSLGAGGIGGALRLLPDAGRERTGRLEGHLTIGSFDTVSGTLRGRWRLGEGWRAGGGAGGEWTDGDYPYLDDRGTRFDPSDDVLRRRRAGHLGRGWSLWHLNGRLGPARLSAMVLALARTGGLQGAPVAEPRWVRRADRGLLWGIAARWGASIDAVEGDALRLSAAGWLAGRSVADPFGEVFPGGSVRRDGTSRIQLRLDGRRAFVGGWWLSGLATLVTERFEPHERLHDVVLPSSRRWRVPLGAEVGWKGRWVGRRVHLRLQGRIEPWWARIGAVRPERRGASDAGADVAFSSRCSAAIEPVRGVSLSASVGRALRLPSLVELFGDGVWLLGEERLRPERAWLLEGGVSLAGRSGPLQGRAELRAFGNWVGDLVRYVRNSRFQVVPRNVDRARLLGVEAGVEGRLERVEMRLAATWMDPLDLGLGKRLPLRPSARFFARLGVRLGGDVRWLPYADVEYVGATFADPANTVQVPQRAVLGAGLWVGRGEPGDARWSFRISLRDLFDVRPYDVVGYPLPGRRWSMELSLGGPSR